MDENDRVLIAIRLPSSWKLLLVGLSIIASFVFGYLIALLLDEIFGFLQ